MKVLAISGWKQNGKDTLADYLIAKHGATRVSFADPLKDMAAKEYDISRESLDLPSQKEKPILRLPANPQDAFSRMLCEFLFREFRDSAGNQPVAFEYRQGELYGLFQIDPTTGNPVKEGGIMEGHRLYWTPRALAIMKGSSNRAVRSDYWVSQAIELAKSKGGLIVISDLRYKSEMAQMRTAFGEDMVTLRVQRYDTSPSTDPSERDLDDGNFDFFVSNRGTLDELYEKMENILEQLGITNPDRSQAV
jgi:hypothetical protein